MRRAAPIDRAYRPPLGRPWHLAALEAVLEDLGRRGTETFSKAMIAR
jgi:hypothetical protein